MAFLNLDRLNFELERFKAKRGGYNPNLTGAGLRDLLADQSWYQILIPAEELAFDSFEKVSRWEEIALWLLKTYTKRRTTPSASANGRCRTWSENRFWASLATPYRHCLSD